MDSVLTMSQPRAFVAKKAIGIWVALEHCPQVEGGDPPTLLSPGEASPRVLCTVLDFPVQDMDILERVLLRATKTIKGL